MGKASKWFRAILGLRKPDSSSISSSASCAPSQTPPPSSISKPPPVKKKRSFVQSFREKENSDHYDHRGSLRVTGGGGRGCAVGISANTTSTAATGPREQLGLAGKGCGRHNECAAVKIQSHFRAYLSRRALRALQSLVKLQALIRGQIVRKHTSIMIRSMALELLQIHAISRSDPLLIIESPLKSNQLHFLGPETPEKFEHTIRSKSMKHGENSSFWRNGFNPKSNDAAYHDKVQKGPKWRDSPTELRPFQPEGFSFRTNSREDENCISTLNLDPKRSYTTPTRRNLFYSSHLSLGSNQCDHTLLTSNQSTHNPIISPRPEPYLASSRSGHGSMFGPLTPTKSDSSRSCMSCNSDQPNYRAYTASSKAKIRSLSAPKQRPQFERSSSTKRYSLHGNVDSRIRDHPVSSAVNANLTTKAYSGSGRLDRVGMPHREQAIGFSGYHPHL